MRLTILGNAAGAPGPDGAGPGYLVESDGAAVLLDCGPGVVGKLVAHRPVSTLSAVVLSHTHLDHLYDLPILFLKRTMEHWMSPQQGGDGEAPTTELHVYLPPGGVAEIERILVGFGIGQGDGGGMDLLGGVALEEYDPQAALTVGDLSITFVGPTRHAPGDCYAMRVTDATGTLLAYSGDTSPDPMVAQMAQDTDCFLCEATLVDTDDLPGQDERHMTARAAGSYAMQGHSRFLLLTHLLGHTPEWIARMERAARETFDGPVAVAQIGQTFALTAGAPREG